MVPENQSLDVMPWIILFIAGLLALWSVFLRLRTKGLNLPPSPGWSLPLYGHLLLVKKNPKKQFREWGKRFGGMFSLKMGSKRIVVITEFRLMKEILVRRADVFSDRADKFITDICPFVEDGIIMSSGEHWKEQRTLALAILRSLSAGTNPLEERVASEAKCLWRWLVSFQGARIDIKPTILVAVCNVLSSAMFNKRFHYRDERILKLLRVMEEHERLGYSVGILNYFPCFRYLPFDLFKMKSFKQTGDEIYAHVQEFVEGVKSTFNPEVLDCFTAYYLRKLNEREYVTATSSLSESSLTASVINLFVAGTDSTANTLEWAILYAVNYPCVQEIIYREILQNVGSEQTPTFQDRHCLHYLRAFIYEVQRMSSVAPFAVTHACKEQVEVRGFTFPAGTQIIPDLDAVHHSEELWGDPHTFRPERFLDHEGKVVSREDFIPFSMGRRKCLGKDLAETILFLFLSATFQQFQFVPVDANSPPTKTEAPGAMSLAMPFRVRCVERREDDSWEL